MLFQLQFMTYYCGFDSRGNAGNYLSRRAQFQAACSVIKQSVVVLAIRLNGFQVPVNYFGWAVPLPKNSKQEQRAV